MAEALTSLDGIKAPAGTKLWIMHLGYLECDEAFLLRGGGTGTKSNPNPPHKRRKLPMISALIDHPIDGLILFETGGGEDYPTTWGAPLNDLFARVDYVEDQELASAVQKTGHKMSDIKAVILGHLHLDHAGGLHAFKGTDVPIYVHEKELQHAFFSVAAKTDLGVYLPHYLTFDINWKPFYGEFLEIAQGINIRHSPGHTPGLCIMQVNMPQSGTFIFTSDQYHIKDNYTEDTIQGWLARDHDDWQRSHQMIKMLQKRTKGRLIFGHEITTLQEFDMAPKFYQ